MHGKPCAHGDIYSVVHHGVRRTRRVNHLEDTAQSVRTHGHDRAVPTCHLYCGSADLQCVNAGRSHCVRWRYRCVRWSDRRVNQKTNELIGSRPTRGICPQVTAVTRWKGCAQLGISRHALHSRFSRQQFANGGHNCISVGSDDFITVSRSI